MMAPELFRVFAEEFTAEWHCLQAEAPAGLIARHHELERLDRQLAKLVDALAEGAPVSVVKARMVDLKSHKAALAAELQGAKAPAPRLHPALAEVYAPRRPS